MVLRRGSQKAPQDNPKQYFYIQKMIWTPKTTQEFIKIYLAHCSICLLSLCGAFSVLALCTRHGPLCVLPPGPGWGPVRVEARSGLGPIWAHMGPYGSSWTGLGRSGHVRFLIFGGILFVCFGFKIGFSTKFLDDSVWFLPEKLNKYFFVHQKP